MDKRLFLGVAAVIMALFSFSAYAADAAQLKHGEEIYNKACKTCHTPDVAVSLKSPAEHDVAAWKARFEIAEAATKTEPNKYKKPIDYLVASVKNGKGAMPPGGMCVNASTPDKKCTDDDYIAAIKFMSSPKEG